VVVIPESGGLLFEGIVAGAGFAGGEPVFGVAVVFRGDLGAVHVGDGADFRDVGSAAVQGVVDGEKVFGGEVVDPGDFERLVAVSFNERGKGGGAVAPHACGRYVAVDFGVNLPHRDGESALAVVDCGACDLRKRQRVYERGQFQRVQHDGLAAGRNGVSWFLVTHLHLCHVHLREGAR
jgi:hypothetical protein